MRARAALRRGHLTRAPLRSEQLRGVIDQRRVLEAEIERVRTDIDISSRQLEASKRRKEEDELQISQRAAASIRSSPRLNHPQSRGSWRNPASFSFESRPPFGRSCVRRWWKRSWRGWSARWQRRWDTS